MTTFREKMMEDHPEYVNEIWEGGCKDCPGVYYNGGKCIQIDNCGIDRDCTTCWDREMPEDGGKKMRFKVGDRVRVREDLEINKDYGGYTFNNCMSKLKGDSYEIKEMDKNSYFLKDEAQWHYTDEMLEPTEFTKSDLKEGMICTTRNGDRWIWFNGYLCNVSMAIFSEYLKENLKHKNECSFDIVKISMLPKGFYTTFKCIFEGVVSKEIVLWERKDEPEPKKMTVNEIEELLGHPVEIVSEKI